MSHQGLSLREHVGGQLARLGVASGLPDTRSAQTLLRELLGPAGGRALTQPPSWPSNIADDHTPVEFSLALAADRAPTLRILGEALPAEPGPAANLRHARELLARWAPEYGLTMDRLDRVADLFLPDVPAGLFGLWFSLVFPPAGPPAIKVYLDPAVRGADSAPELVEEGLRRLGLAAGYGPLRARMTDRDHFTFFALDLHDRAGSRVKVYVAHEHATTDDIVRATGAATDVDPATVVEFCAQAGGGHGPFDNQPLLSGYTFLDSDADRPSGYSLYMPIRGYVRDDSEARQRAAKLLANHGLDADVLDRAVGALTDRSMDSGVGLIAHVSLRLGGGAPGITLYLSSEAYAAAEPNPHVQVGCCAR